MIKERKKEKKNEKDVQSDYGRGNRALHRKTETHKNSLARSMVVLAAVVALQNVN